MSEQLVKQIEGMQACKDGKPCPGKDDQNFDADFEYGYSVQYQFDQVFDSRTARHD